MKIKTSDWENEVKLNKIQHRPCDGSGTTRPITHCKSQIPQQTRPIFLNLIIIIVVFIWLIIIVNIFYSLCCVLCVCNKV